jgi:dynein heavy chain
MREAEEALNKLNKNDISEIKGFTSPPPAVQMVMEAVSILLGTGTEWSQIKLVMMDMNFIDRLRNFDKSSISDMTLKKLRTYTTRPDFDPVLVGQKNVASKSMCMWCKAMDNYCKVAKEVEPKKKKVAELEAKMDKKNK